MRIAATTLLVMALGAAGCASDGTDKMEAADTGTSGKECFWMSEVSGFRDAGRDKIIVSTGPNERFLFETFGSCPGLNFSERLAFEKVGPGRICSGLDVNIITVDEPIKRTCPVRMVKKLTKEEAKQY